MSEEKRERLAETLTQLNVEDKAWAINYLVQLLALQSNGGKHKVAARHNDTFTDQQWEAYFAGVPQKELPTSTPASNEVLRVTTGKTIKPLAKWL